MGAIQEKRDRQVIPRWRTLPSAIVLGELRYGHGDEWRDLTRGLDELEQAWRASQHIHDAAELAGAAMTAGLPDRASSAKLALEQGKPLFQTVAAGLGDETTQDEDASDVSEPRILRAAIRHDIHNTLAWLDLGRWQLIAGHREAAQKSIRIASQLAPDNRYVVRSSARFYVEIGDPERAIWLLSQALAETDDPWLIAPEIAARQLLGQSSRFLTKARRDLLSLDKADWFALSELAAQVGTVEARDGLARRAKRLFQSALLDPTENALAQVVAVMGRAGSLVTSNAVSQAMTRVHQPAEARAIQASKAGEFEAARLATQSWLHDQPFSLEAAEFGSFIAAAGCENWASAAQFAESGLLIHPENVGLMNNLAYALIEQNRLEDAAIWLKRSEAGRVDERSRAVLLATRGLLDFRRGDQVEGALKYEAAISLARSTRESVVAASASAMYARELKNGALATEMLKNARRLVGNDNPVVAALVDRTEARIGN